VHTAEENAFASFLAPPTTPEPRVGITDERYGSAGMNGGKEKREY